VSLLQAFIDRVLGRTNPTPQVVLAISDDGSADPVAAGKLSPLRADPTTGELLVKSSGGGGGGGGAVTQSTGSTSTPWYVQGVNGGSAERLATFAKQPALGTAGSASTDVITVQGIAGATPLPSSNAASSQADGHSVTIGTTTDADTTSTVIGRLKKIVSLLAGGLPAALGANGGLKIEGVASGTVVPVDTELPTAAALSDTTVNPTAPMIGAAIMGFDRFSATSWNRWTMNQFGGVVQGYTANGAALSGAERPVWIAGWDGSSKRALLCDASGRMSVIGNRVARTAHLASAALPAAGAFTSQTAYAVPEGVVGITAYVTYTRGTTGGTVLLRPEYGNGTETARESIAISSTASSENIRDTLGFREFVSPSADSIFAIEFDVPAGCTTFRLLAAELGVTATPGTCAITLTAKYGGS
jgi:hypothetical protein